VVRVLLFAALRDAAGESRLEVEATNVGALLDQLAARFGPEFARVLAIGTVVVDGETVGRDRPLSPGEEVALLPPVSGGARAV
jgi:MoaD family protein